MNLTYKNIKMKKLIRKSVFETNSSSAHSLAFATDISNAVYDTIYPDEDGYVVVDCSDYSFVRQVPRITNDTKEKIAFFASLYSETYYDDEEKMELLESVIKANSKAHKVMFLGFNYVTIDFKNDFDLPQDFDELYRVIFDKNCYLRIAGDEYDFASEEDEELFNNPPIVKAEKYKNKLVRTSVFETNSSSAHSLSINKGNKVLNVFDTLKPDKNGVVRIDCGGYKFTRQKPRRTNDTKEKIAFFATLFDSLTYYKKELEELSYPETIAKGMEYALLNGGKRLRPFLLFTTLELLNQDIQKGVKSAIGIEMIHSYSLVHDDLPALDNDDYRRGKLTTHKVFGEAEAILIGDALLTYAFYMLSEKNLNILSFEQITKIISKTSAYSGINGMIGGQMIDIESENKKINLETLKYIHKHKTGKLIKLPIEIACIIADVSEDKRLVLEEYAELIGLAFQVKDDILDIEGTFEDLGKPVGSDDDLHKATYPSILGMEESKKILNETVERAKKIIHNMFGEEKGKILISLADFIRERKS